MVPEDEGGVARWLGISGDPLNAGQFLDVFIRKRGYFSPCFRQTQFTYEQLFNLDCCLTVKDGSNL